MLLGVQVEHLTPTEALVLVEGRAGGRKVAIEERASLNALVLSTRLEYEALFNIAEDGREKWFSEDNPIYPSPKRLLDRWMGRAKPAEEQEAKPFYTPELEGEEIELDL